MGAVLVITCDHGGGGLCGHDINGFVRWISDKRLTDMLRQRGWKRVEAESGFDDYYFCPQHYDEEPAHD